MRRLVQRARGFSLVELGVVLAIVGMLLFLFIPANISILTGQRRANTTQKLANLENALTNFVIVNKRLPCPSNGTLIPPNVAAGVEGTRDGNGDCSNPAGQANGVVPWVALGLNFTDILDSWDNQITYRVGYGLTRNNALDMSYCDPAGTAAVTGIITVTPNINLGSCLTTCTSMTSFDPTKCTTPQNYLDRRGLDVKSSATVVAMNYLQFTGAAFVLISHGENGYGALTNAGAYRSSPMRGIAGTTLEDPNRNLATLTIPAAAPPQFMSANYSDANDATIYFDDIVVRPMVMSVISKAQLGPRTH